MARYKNLYRLSKESETVVEEVQDVDPTVVTEYNNNVDEISTASDAIEEGCETTEVLSEQIDKNEEAIESSSTTDEEATDLAQESANLLAYAMGKIGVPSEEFNRKKLSVESSLPPKTQLKITTEGLKEFAKTVWEKIKAAFKWIWETIKKVIRTIGKALKYYILGINDFQKESIEASTIVGTMLVLINTRVPPEKREEYKKRIYDITNTSKNHKEMMEGYRKLQAEIMMMPPLNKNDIMSKIYKPKSDPKTVSLAYIPDNVTELVNTNFGRILIKGNNGNIVVDEIIFEEFIRFLGEIMIKNIQIATDKFISITKKPLSEVFEDTSNENVIHEYFTAILKPNTNKNVTKFFNNADNVVWYEESLARYVTLKDNKLVSEECLTKITDTIEIKDINGKVSPRVLGWVIEIMKEMVTSKIDKNIEILEKSFESISKEIAKLDGWSPEANNDQVIKNAKDLLNVSGHLLQANINIPKLVESITKYLEAYNILYINGILEEEIIDI